MGRHESRLMRFAINYPRGWHSMGGNAAERRAMRNLADSGLLELSESGKQFRLPIPADCREAMARDAAREAPEQAAELESDIARLEAELAEKRERLGRYNWSRPLGGDVTRVEIEESR